MEIKADDIMTKVDVIEKCVEAAAHPTDRVNRMGCYEDWYDKWYAVGTTFSEDELNNMSGLEIAHLLRLAEAIGDALY